MAVATAPALVVTRQLAVVAIALATAAQPRRVLVRRIATLRAVRRMIRAYRAAIAIIARQVRLARRTIRAVLARRVAVIAAAVARRRAVAVVAAMALYESIPVIQDVFHITYIQNKGAAFSIMEGQINFLILLPMVMIIAAVIFMLVMRKKGHPVLMTSVALIAGGGIGNLIDRIALGYVVDYLDFRVFPIFNLADIAVCVGCGLLVLYVLLIDGKQKNE